VVHRCMGMALVEVCWNRGARCVNSKRLSSIRCRCKGSCLQLANSVNERYHRQDEETTKTMMSKEQTRMEVPTQEAGGSECHTFHACAPRNRLGLLVAPARFAGGFACTLHLCITAAVWDASTALGIACDR
jgi:hypothetical protein